MSSSHSFPSLPTDDPHGPGFRSSSSSSFRINPASEIPRSRTVTLNSNASSHLNGSSLNGSWDDSAFRSSTHFNGNDDHDEKQDSHFRQSSSSTTLRPLSASLHVPKVAPVTKFVSARQKPRVAREEVWRDILLSSYGRDKALKLIQYTFRLYLFFHFKAIFAVNRPHLGHDLTKRMKATMSGLSLARKCLLLFNWLTPLIQITNPPPLPFQSTPPSSPSSSTTMFSKPVQRPLLYRLLHASPPTLLELSNAFTDDTYTFSRLGLIPTSIGNKADRLSNWFWFASTIVGLVEVGVDRGTVLSLMSNLENRIYDDEMDTKMLGRGGKSHGNSNSIDLKPTGVPNAVDLSVGAEEADEGLQKIREQYQTIQISMWKLIMDLIFVSYEVFRIKRWREPVMATTGLVSGILSTWKLYSKHYTSLAKTSDEDNGM